MKILRDWAIAQRLGSQPVTDWRCVHERESSAALSRQPQRGSAAPYLPVPTTGGSLGAITHWGDNVRVEAPADGKGH